MKIGRSSRKNFKDKENTAPSNIHAEENSVGDFSSKNKKHFQ